MRILIAEDETSSRFLLETTLRKRGYETVVASDGLQAWDLLQRNDAPQIAILDCTMPGLAGPEICRRIRERENHPYTYLILLTALNGKEDLADSRW
ncbi:MAG: response regulator [Blastocatellia bacterium]